MDKKQNSNQILTITAVGDICFSDHLLCSGFGVESIIKKKGSEFIFSKIHNELKNSDIVFGNLECVLSEIGKTNNKIKTKLFRGKSNYVRILKDNGFNLVNVANNHSMQHGPKAFNEMKSKLEENNILALGLKGFDNVSSMPVIFKKEDKKFTFIGYSLVKERNAKKNIGYAYSTISKIKNDIKVLKSTTDILVLSCHWGLEGLNYPSVNIIDLSKEFIDAGADIIIGHHSHTIQGEMRYKDKLVIFSLGNFVFDLHWDTENKKTGIYKINIFDNGKMDYSFLPVIINKKYQPEIFKYIGWDKRFYYKQEESIDKDDENLNYMAEFLKKEKKIFWYKILFILKNILKVNKLLLLSFIFWKIKSKI